MLKIEVNTENAAFGCDSESKWEREYFRNEEIKRVLKNICNQLDNGYASGSCLDINGNVVQHFINRSAYKYCCYVTYL